MQILVAVVPGEVVPRWDPEREKMEYVTMKVGQGTLYNMVENNVAHKFIREEVETKVGLMFSPIQDSIKGLKSPLVKLIGVAGNVDVNIVEWFGKINLTIM